MTVDMNLNYMTTNFMNFIEHGDKCREGSLFTVM